MKPSGKHHFREPPRLQGGLAETTGLLQVLIDSLPDIIYVKDTDHRFLICNLAVANQFGLTSTDDVIGKTDYDFHPHEQADEYHRFERGLLETGESLVGHQELVVYSTGEGQWYSSTKVPLRDETGALVGLIGIGRNIDRRKRAEDQARQFAEELAAHSAAMEADLDLARELQQAVLPVGQPAVHIRDRAHERSLQIHYRYLPSAKLGGDFLDVYEISDTAVGVFICDAVGHGARAALLTALVKGMLDQLRSLAGDPGALMTEMNRALRRVLERQHDTIFLTASCLVFDLQAQTLTCANAGHHPPLRRRRGGRYEPLPVTSSGPALALLSGATYPSHACSIKPGEAWIAYTDGLFEVRVAGGGEFGHEALVELLNRQEGAPGETLLDAVIDGVRSACGTREFEDDVCVVRIELIEA